MLSPSATPQDPHDLIPGSLLAAASGCTCTEDQPPDEELVDIDCPLHGILSAEGPDLPETA